MIGDPYASPVFQRTKMYLVAQALNVVDDNNMNQISALIQRCETDEAPHSSAAVKSCGAIMDYIMAVSGDVFDYDSRIFTYDWDPLEAPITQLLANSSKADQLYKAIHIENSFKVPKFEMSSDAVDLGYKMNNMEDYSRFYNYLIDANFPLLVMAGEFDGRDGNAMQPMWMKRTVTSLKEEFWQQDRKVYYFDAQNKTQVGGYYHTQGRFTYLTVPKSGHFIPTDYYFASKAYLDDYV